MGLPQLNPEERTGLVYQCLLRSSMECNGLLSDSNDVTNNDRRLFDGDRKNVHIYQHAYESLFLSFLANGNAGLLGDPEVKSDQLMGSVLASSGDIFVVRQLHSYMCSVHVTFSCRLVLHVG